jgi:hypothetical protein
VDQHTRIVSHNLDHWLGRGSPLLPDLMTPAERLDEVARLLALGYLRLRARRQAQKVNDPKYLREFGLDFRGEGSVCDTDTHADRERP